MIGAIIGDIVGSRFEFNNHRSKEFELFTPECSVTDDSIMTIAIATAVRISKITGRTLSRLAVSCMRNIGMDYPTCGYGGSFCRWMYSVNPQPYNSFGNGAAMRVSSCGLIAKSLEEALLMSDAVTTVTHNHAEGIKGARATTAAVYLAKSGMSKEEIRREIQDKYYDLNFTLDEIRSTYRFNETCQDTVPQAIQAFLESTSFEDAIRNAISIGGDSDTLAAITGAIAGAFYGVPEELKNKALKYLDKTLLRLYYEFERFMEGV